MELASVRIFVRDLPAATRFYAEVVGLEQVGGTPEVALFGGDYHEGVPAGAPAPLPT